MLLVEDHFTHNGYLISKITKFHKIAPCSLRYQGKQYKSNTIRSQSANMVI